MKNLFNKLSILAILCCFVFSAASMPASAVEANPTIRIGLAYGTGTLPSANLENVSGLGSGFKLGYFNSSYAFIQVGYTASTNISTMKDSNMYYTGSAGSLSFDSTLYAGNTGSVGAYHVQLGTYPDFSSASAAAAMYSGAFPAYVNGVYCVRIGNYLSLGEAQNAAGSYSGGTAVGGSSTGYTVVDRTTAEILFEFDYGTVTAFGIMPDITGADDVQTWFKGYKYRGGFEYKRLTGNDITVINYVTIDDYAKGILPYEMSSSWPLEALKAQCLAAKSYTLCNLGKHKASGFDLCNTTDCQVYRGTNGANSNSDLAVEQTSGEYVLYNGSPAQCYYYSSNGGASEDAANVWGSDVPYLKGVVDTYETVNSSYSHTFTPSELGWLFNASGYSNSGTIVKCYVSKTTAMGNVYSVTFVDSAGKSFTVSKEAARNLFYSNSLGNTQTSQRYTIVTNYADGTNSDSSSGVYVNGASTEITDFSEIYAIGSGGTAKIGSKSATAITGSGNTEAVSSGGSSSGGTAVSFTVKGTGYGHNVGMSQWGAYAMAKAGYTYKQILTFYYTGVTIGR